MMSDHYMRFKLGRFGVKYYLLFTPRYISFIIYILAYNMCYGIDYLTEIFVVVMRTDTWYDCGLSKLDMGLMILLDTE